MRPLWVSDNAEERGIELVLVGGAAGALVWGSPRLTADLDVVVKGRDELARLEEALESLPHHGRPHQLGVGAAELDAVGEPVGGVPLLRGGKDNGDLAHPPLELIEVWGVRARNLVTVVHGAPPSLSCRWAECPAAASLESVGTRRPGLAFESITRLVLRCWTHRHTDLEMTPIGSR